MPKFHFSRREIQEIVLAWAVISLAFAIVLHGLSFDFSLVIAIIFSAVTAGIGFVLHEIAHKYMALRYHLHAEFFANKLMLVIALATSLFGLIIAAPGAVAIIGHTTKDRFGKIALAGPLMNLGIALLFLIGLLAFQTNPLAEVLRYGFHINAFLALFNLLPVYGFDGFPVFVWNKLWFGLSIGIAAILTFTSFLI
jgi:Zn-dependent protease